MPTGNYFQKQEFLTAVIRNPVPLQKILTKLSKKSKPRNFALVLVPRKFPTAMISPSWMGYLYHLN